MLKGKSAGQTWYNKDEVKITKPEERDRLKIHTWRDIVEEYLVPLYVEAMQTGKPCVFEVEDIDRMSTVRTKLAVDPVFRLRQYKKSTTRYFFWLTKRNGDRNPCDLFFAPTKTYNSYTEEEWIAVLKDAAGKMAARQEQEDKQLKEA